MKRFKVFLITFLLVIAAGVTAQTSNIFNLTDTWNDGGATFDAIKMDVTDTASATDSRLLNLSVGGVEKFIVNKNGQVTIDQGTNDAPFFDFQATADADTTSAISTLTTSGAVQGHIQIEINGIKRWIAILADPS